MDLPAATSRRPGGFAHLLERIRARYHPLWRLRRSRWLHQMMAACDFPVWAKFHEPSFELRVYWYRDLPWLFPSLSRETELNALVRALCAEFAPRVFWDIGANLGWYTGLVSSLCELQSAVAIEPLPENVRLLRRMIARNRFSHVTVIEAAVADRCGECEVVVDSKSGAA